MPKAYYERDEDWQIVCPDCHGNGAIGTGDKRKLCPKCNGSGRVKQ